eukprot:COSAG01_NODE_19075_length_1032_cov_1.251876_1_plen_130_part_00
MVYPLECVCIDCVSQPLCLSKPLARARARGGHAGLHAGAFPRSHRQRALLDAAHRATHKDRVASARPTRRAVHQRKQPMTWLHAQDIQLSDQSYGSETADTLRHSSVSTQASAMRGPNWVYQWHVGPSS